MTRTLSLALVAAALAAPAGAATFSPTGATASSFFSASYDPGNTIDGSGVGGPGFAPTAIHTTYAENNHWTSTGADALDQWIEWSFAAPSTIGGLWIWNHLSNGVASNPFYEPTEFSLTFYDAVDTVLTSFSGVALDPQPVGGPVGASQGFTLDVALTGVSAVRFDVDGKEPPLDSYTGLAEVLFSDEVIAGATSLAAVPLPASGLLLIAALGGIGAARRRRT